MLNGVLVELNTQFKKSKCTEVSTHRKWLSVRINLTSKILQKNCIKINNKNIRKCCFYC